MIAAPVGGETEGRTAPLPPQDASTGVLRLCVRTGTYGQLTVRGNRWYSREQLLRALGVFSLLKVRDPALRRLLEDEWGGPLGD